MAFLLTVQDTIDQARKEFYSTRERLRECVNEEETKIVGEMLEAASIELWKVDSDFRAMVTKPPPIFNTDETRAEDKQRFSNLRENAEYRIRNIKSNVDSKFKEAKKQSSSLRMEAERLRARSQRDIDIFVQKTRFKVLNQNALEKELEEQLVCPICHNKNQGNMLNRIPFCFNCNHRLVSKSELKDYNRAYRRSWERGR